MIRILPWIIILPLYFVGHDAAKILGIGWFPAKSHQATFQPIWRELSKRGHEVTAITTLPIRDPNLRNLTEIDISDLFEEIAKRDLPKNFSKENWLWSMVLYVKNLLQDLLEAMMNNVDVKKLIASDTRFDVIIVESHHPLLYAFGERFKAPVIAVSSFGADNEIHDIYGNPTHPLISPDVIVPVEASPPTNLPILEKLRVSLHNVWGRMLYYWYFLPRADQMAKKHFGKNIPHLTEIIKKYSSILMVNVNFITHPVRANVPAVIELDQMHIRQNNTLPKDLQTYLDASKNGVVYFSLGTSFPSSSLDNGTINEIINTFSQLPFNVLWKWEKDVHPPVSSNVLIRKFFPQQDLLAHPNIKVFVTQGGIQSIEEAISKGVPMVGMPFLADQPPNVKRLLELGVGVSVDPSKLTREALSKAILEIATNASYKQKVRELKSVLEDQPLKGVEKAIWWIEYVIRHKGAQHLKSPAAEMSFFEYFLIDVLAVLLTTIAVMSYASYMFVILLRSIFKQKPKND